MFLEVPDCRHNESENRVPLPTTMSSDVLVLRLHLWLCVMLRFAKIEAVKSFDTLFFFCYTRCVFCAVSQRRGGNFFDMCCICRLYLLVLIVGFLLP